MLDESRDRLRWRADRGTKRTLAASHAAPGESRRLCAARPINITTKYSEPQYSDPSTLLCVQDYTITIYLNQYWNDERLSFSDSGEDNMTLTGDFTEKIWVPDTFFANDKLSFLHMVTEKNHMIRLYGDGSIVYGMRSASSVRRS